MQPCLSDPSLYFKLDNGTLIGLTGNYVDDVLNAGTAEFETLTEATLKRFDCKEREYDNFAFFGPRLQTVKEGGFMLNQEQYCKSLAKLTPTANMKSFQRSRALLAWTTHSRPELACLVNKSAQVSEETLKAEHISALNNGIKRALENPFCGLLYLPLHFDTIHMRIYADASFASNEDYS